MELCSLAAVEHDPKKLIVLGREINQLFQEKRRKVVFQAEQQVSEKQAA
jgi:hypothetical protein